MDAVETYAREVVAGHISAGKYHRLACARHLKDLGRQQTPAFPYRFELAKAERFWKFAQRLKHYKGEWAGQLIVLRPDQLFRKGVKYGWVHSATGLRRFRNSYEEIPRKNGKTLEAAIETLYNTFFCGEGGAEGYCAGVKRDQALLVFRDCKKLVESSALNKRLDVRASNINAPTTSSKLEPLSSDYNSLDGLNISFVNLDELHAYKTRDLIDVLETATGARREPLVNKITTAGNNPVSPCGDEHDYACKILDGILEDETYFAFIAHADEGDDWRKPETAAKANPSYGISVKPDDLAAKVTQAKGIPSKAAAYKQKHLNLWVNAVAPCLSVDGWRQGQSEWSPDEMLHEPCWVGIDLASKIDICSMSLVFPPTVDRLKWRLVQYLWTPEDTLKERAHTDRAPYDVWADQDWLIQVPGTRVDHQLIRGVLEKERERFDIEVIGFDPWHADTLIDQLIREDGFDEAQVLAVSQTYAGMSSAASHFKAEVLAGNVDARGCPVTAWAVSNVVEQTDGKGNIFFTKKKSIGRIDPVISATIGMALYLRQPVKQEPKYQMMILGR